MQNEVSSGSGAPAVRVKCVPAAGDWALVLVVALAILIVITRVPLLPRYLYYFDSVNFALALEEFNPAKHQPQPPGYPGFVLVARALYALFPSPEVSLALAGLAIALGALVLTWRVAGAMFGREAGILAAAILALNPPFWLGGVTNEVRLCLALNTTAIGFVCWRALQRPASRTLFLVACAVLGFMAGFRPVETPLLAPLVLFVWWRSRRSVADLLAGIGVALAAALPWIAWTANASGGLQQAIDLMRAYGRSQFQSSSLFFGASLGGAFLMAKQAVVWSGLGVVTWIWAVPFARRIPGLDFLAVWFLPGFLFSALIHIGDPDQALLTVPVLCIAGGGILHSVLRTFDLPRLAATMLAILAVNAALFCLPPGRIARASSVHAVRSVDLRTQSVFKSIRELSGGSGRKVTILHYGSIVTWRHLFFYFPQHHITWLPQERNETCMTLYRRTLEDNQHCAAHLAPAQRYILMAPHLNPAWLKEQGWQQHGPVYWRDAAPNLALEIGRYRLRS